jgi:virulence-associated protein VapD
MRHRFRPTLRVVGGSQRPKTPLAVTSDQASFPGAHLPNTQQWSRRMYAIAFDLDWERLQRHYPGSYPQNAYDDIKRVFAEHGFRRQQGSVYFADAAEVDAVKCVLAVQALSAKYTWFRAVVNDIRMLRIEDNNDLMPAVGDLVLPLAPPTAAAE